MKKPTYEPHICQECGQSTTYLLAVDKGTVDIVRAIAAAIGRKGINIIHATKEMEVPHKEWSLGRAIREGVLTSTQIGNISRARFHGLVASVEGNRGNYCLTTKGIDFLKGAKIPKYAVISKAESKQIGYFEPEQCAVTVHSFTTAGEYWEGVNFIIEGGRIVRSPTQTMLV